MKRRIKNRAALELYIQRIKSMPIEIKTEVLSWEHIDRSPYSFSFYSSHQKRWNFTPKGCLRVSTHWNFKKRNHSGKEIIHCKTDISVINNTHWTLARFENGVWQVVKSLPCVKLQKKSR